MNATKLGMAKSKEGESAILKKFEESQKLDSYKNMA